MTQTRARFVKVRCDKCKNEQTIFSNASTKIACLVCKEVLAEPSGGKAKVKASVLEILS